jgi:hypothetical protein
MESYPPDDAPEPDPELLPDPEPTPVDLGDEPLKAYRKSYDLPSRKGTYDLKALGDIHMQIIRMEVQGIYTREEIAQTLGVTTELIRYTLKSPLAQQQVALMRAVLDARAVETAKMITELAPIAAIKLGAILVDDAGDKKLQAKVAMDVLDRAGYQPPKEPDQHLHLHGHATLEDLRSIQRLAAERSAQKKLSDREPEP